MKIFNRTTRAVTNTNINQSSVALQIFKSVNRREASRAKNFQKLVSSLSSVVSPFFKNFIFKNFQTRLCFLLSHHNHHHHQERERESQSQSQRERVRESQRERQKERQKEREKMPPKKLVEKSSAGGKKRERNVNEVAKNAPAKLMTTTTSASKKAKITVKSAKKRKASKEEEIIDRWFRELCANVVVDGDYGGPLEGMATGNIDIETVKRDNK